jgi:LAO/AO transport system kinase
MTNPKKTGSWQLMAEAIKEGNRKTLSRAISLIENEFPGYEALLENLPAKDSTRVVDLRSAGRRKSTIIDALIGQWSDSSKKIAVLCVDPSSPFHRGALLGDRIRMSGWFNQPNIFIRSLASRGALGGLHPKIIEIVDLLGAAGFEFVLLETVGVGQNEVDIASLSETCVVVLVPEAGDDIQTMKSGLMEIADILVVNKADRPDAHEFEKHLYAVRSMNPDIGSKAPVPILKTIGSQNKGIAELAAAILQDQQSKNHAGQRTILLARKAFQLIAQKKIRDIDQAELELKIQAELHNPDFNLYRFVSTY